MLEGASLKSSVCVAEQGRHMQGVVIWRRRLRSLLLEAVFSPASRTRVVYVSRAQVPTVTEEDPGVHNVAVEDGSRGRSRGPRPRTGRMNGKSGVRVSVFRMFSY